jgi:mono/diheme cytochrome c family protein
MSSTPRTALFSSVAASAVRAGRSAFGVAVGLLAGAGSPLAATPAAPLPTAEAESLFVKRVLPMLQEKCLSCHGRDEEKIKGGLDLRTREEALFGGDSLQPSLVPGKPDASPLYLAVLRDHADWEAMPPKDNDALSAEQRAYLRDWIAAGAPWPDAVRTKELLAQKDKWSVEDGVTVTTSGGLSDDWTHRRYKPENLWAYLPLRKPVLPAPGSSIAHPVDLFLNAKLAAAGLTPAPRADRRTLIRRVTFDLTGLPPTPEEVAAFIADPASEREALAKVVERLLASPHYGEQWARHWLDVVRYADSSGFANDFVRGNTWRYRDYVVRAFNQDKPYDQFIREQIAGDEIAPENPEALVATGFLRMGPWELTGMEVPKVARQRFLDDVTDSVGQVFLAHPLQCARCHDHKFDPVPTKDYYSFQAIFSTTQMAERTAAFLPQENTAGFEEKKYLEQRAEHYRRELARLDAKSMAAARAWYAEKKIDPADFEAALAGVRGGKNKRGREAGFSEVRAALMRQGIPEERIPPKAVGFSPEDYGHERIARKGLERLRWELERYEPVAFAAYSGRTPDVKSVLNPLRMPPQRLTQGELEQPHILTGGDPFANGAPVTPAVLSAPVFLGGMKPEHGIVPAEIEGRRAALAAWITAPENPLTARTYVNRIWLWHFGQAIAGNPNNFGATGKKPSHPELLDWLAATFVEGGWSTKALHRLILSSDAYARASAHAEPRQVAERDADGTLYAVFKPRRLAAEELRDAFLAVSGELNRTVGGIPARPEMNREAALQPRQVMGTFAEAWQPSPKPEQRHRRSLYALKIRGQLDPFMEVFNAPSPDLSCEARDASTVTPQVFSLFNSQATLDRAVAWAARLMDRTAARDEVVNRAFAEAFNRTPSADERRAALAHWDTMTARHRTISVAKPAIPREVVRDAVEENTGEKFSFVEPLEVAADFISDRHISEVPPETRGLAELCLVLLNANEFAYVY